MAISQAGSPIFVRPGQATVYDQMAGEKIHILLPAERTGGALSLFIDEVPPNCGPPLHVHRNEDETFYVVEGELVVEVDGERSKIAAGSAAFLPRGVPHTFANLSNRVVRTLIAATPGGIEHFFAKVEPLVTQEEPDMTDVIATAAAHGVEVVGPPLSAMQDAPAKANGLPLTRSDQVTTFSGPSDETMQILLSSEETGGQLALMVGEFPSGVGVSLHRHRHEHEVLYILSGVLTLQIGQKKTTVSAGSAAFAPRGIAHRFCNESDATVRALAIITPGGFEKYFGESFALAAQGALDEEMATSLLQKYGVETVG